MLRAYNDFLRILPHTSFDSHLILGVSNRKPIPALPVVTRFTNWQLGITGGDSTMPGAIV